MNHQGEADPASSGGPPGKELSRPRWPAVLLWLATVLCCAFIFYLSSLEGGEIEESTLASALDAASFSFENGFDKLGHFVLYSILGSLFYLACLKSFPLSPQLTTVLEDIGRPFSSVFRRLGWEKLPGALKGMIFASFSFTSIYGLSDEFHQYFVPGRSPSVLDLVVDGLSGLVVALVLTWLIMRRKQGKPGESS